MTDHLARLTAEGSDVLHYGVKGMKWGVRRTDSELSKAADKFGVNVEGALSKNVKVLKPRSDTKLSLIDELGLKLLNKDIKNAHSAQARADLDVLKKISKLNEKDAKGYPKSGSVFDDERMLRSSIGTDEVSTKLHNTNHRSFLTEYEFSIYHENGRPSETRFAYLLDKKSAKIKHSDSSEDDEDLLHYGIKGMKWGVRKDRRSSGETEKSGEAPSKNPESKKAPAPENQIQNRVESSSERYVRLSGEAKSGSASAWTEQDLKFFNARTEALNKVSKMYEEQPGWFASTMKEVAQNTAKKQIQSVSDAVASKYVSGPLLDAIKGAGAAAATAKASSDKKNAKEPSNGTSGGKDSSSTKKQTSTPGMTREQSIQELRDRMAEPISESKPSPRADLFAELRDIGVLDDED